MASVSVLRQEKFLPSLERVRKELGAKFARAHQVLVKRQSELLSELDQLEERYRGGAIIEQIKDLEKLKEVQLSTTKVNKNKDLVMQHVSELDDRVRKLMEDWEKERASMRRVTLKWDSELEVRLSELGAIWVSNVRDYKEIENPEIVGGMLSEIPMSDGAFYNPQSIAIHPETNNIYVCDAEKNRVQVFTKSLQFLFYFHEKLYYPSGMCISNDSVYVTQDAVAYAVHCLNEYTAEGKFLKSVGKRGKNELEFYDPRGIAVSNDKNRIYICDYENNRIQCLNSNLTFNSVISDIPHPRNIKITAEEIVVLTEGEHWIRYYNHTHQLIREIIPCGEGGHVINPWDFYLDAEQNVLIADSSAHCVLIFTRKVELIHKFGRKGTGRGEFSYPTGMAADSKNRIIVVSHNPNYVLQLF